MTTNHDAIGANAADDEAISRALRALVGYHKLKRNDLAVVFPSSEATLFRRFRVGGWTAGEVKALARAFSVPSGDLLDGKVDTNASAWRPDRGPGGDGGSELPRLDLNQKPAGSRRAFVYMRPGLSVAA